MKEGGFTFADSLLSLAILFLLTLSIFPIVHTLQEHVYEGKLSLHASEVALNAARLVAEYGIYEGNFEIEGNTFYWNWDEQSLCVYYDLYVEREQLCVQ